MKRDRQRTWTTSGTLATTIAAVLLGCTFVQAAPPPGKGGGGGGGGEGSAAYTIVRFAPPDSSSTSSSVEDINEQGHAVGAAEVEGGGSEAVHLDLATGVYTSLQDGFRAEGVNNLNQIVGNTKVADFSLALFWSGPSAEPAVLLPLAGDVTSYALAVNDAGIVIGSSYDGVSMTPDGVALVRGVVWRVAVDADETVHVDGPVELPPQFAGAVTGAHDINEVVGGAAQIVGDSGYQAVVWTIELDSDGAIVAPEAPVPVGTLEGRGINNFAEACGRMESDSVAWGVPFVAFADQDAQPLPVPRGTVFGIANSINDTEEIVGSLRVLQKGSQTGYGKEYAYLWKDGNSIDLNKQIPAKSGWDLKWAEVISNGGIIGGWGQFDVYSRGFLLIANP